jgi:hypothetical protein
MEPSLPLFNCEKHSNSFVDSICVTKNCSNPFLCENCLSSHEDNHGVLKIEEFNDAYELELNYDIAKNPESSINVFEKNETELLTLVRSTRKTMTKTLDDMENNIKSKYSDLTRKYKSSFSDLDKKFVITQGIKSKSIKSHDEFKDSLTQLISGIRQKDNMLGGKIFEISLLSSRINEILMKLDILYKEVKFSLENVSFSLKNVDHSIDTAGLFQVKTYKLFFNKYIFESWLPIF